MIAANVVNFARLSGLPNDKTTNDYLGFNKKFLILKIRPRKRIECTKFMNIIRKHNDNSQLSVKQ